MVPVDTEWVFREPSMVDKQTSIEFYVSKCGNYAKRGHWKDGEFRHVIYSLNKGKRNVNNSNY